MGTLERLLHRNLKEAPHKESLIKLILSKIECLERFLAAEKRTNEHERKNTAYYKRQAEMYHKLYRQETGYL